jgi:UDP-3-O-[3-hydroxymyristoyl] N-acetylglucosamine deacetylase
MPASSSIVPHSVIELQGVGLITGKTVMVQLAQAPKGSGVRFVLANTGAVLPASPQYIADTQRGVTLMHPETKQTLSIVEHFLAAVACSGFADITVTLHGDAPELPLLDGSALPWYEAMLQQWGTSIAETTTQTTSRALEKPIFWSNSTQKVAMYALPAQQFSITYTLDYQHPAFGGDWVTWYGKQDATVSIPQLLSAQTFGWVDELPAMQAKGLALGVTAENTLGLYADGTFTRPLRFDKEPFYHKLLDLMGDFQLCGLPVAQLPSMALVAVNAGHTSHIGFAQELKHQLVSV